MTLRVSSRCYQWAKRLIWIENRRPIQRRRSAGPRSGWPRSHVPPCQKIEQFVDGVGQSKPGYMADWREFSYARLMNLRVLLIFAIFGCSSTAPTSNAPSSMGGNSNASGGGTAGGASNQGGTSGANSGGNTQCAVWPQAKLLPWIGPFFYGPDKGPCSYTEIDRIPGTATTTDTLTFSYAASGEVQSAASADSSISISFTYNQGLIAGDSENNAGSVTSDVFTYTADTLQDQMVSATGAQSSYTYLFDAQGYPQSTAYTEILNGQTVIPAGVAVQYEYSYTNCRIQKRTAYTADGTEVTGYTALYTYDNLGHLTDVNATDYEYTFDYSCWAH